MWCLVIEQIVEYGNSLSSRQRTACDFVFMFQYEP